MQVVELIFNLLLLLVWLMKRRLICLLEVLGNVYEQDGEEQVQQHYIS